MYCKKNVVMPMLFLVPMFTSDGDHGVDRLCHADHNASRCSGGDVSLKGPPHHRRYSIMLISHLLCSFCTKGKLDHVSSRINLSHQSQSHFHLPALSTLMPFLRKTLWFFFFFFSEIKMHFADFWLYPRSLCAAQSTTYIIYFCLFLWSELDFLY